MHTGQPEGKTEPDALGSAVLEEKTEVTPEDLTLENLQISGKSDDAPEEKAELEASSSAVAEEKINVTPKDLELIDEAFASIRKLLEKEYDDDLTNGKIGPYDYYLYMGDNDNDWDFIRPYLENHIQDRSEYFCITSELFRDLFIIHCKKSGQPVAEIAEQKQIAMVKKVGNFAFNRKFFDYLIVKLKPTDRSDSDF
ncbi:uncharacterized protein LOC126837612 [Adelges cooleyi]|uniref:uncharacterized protein LOC126837612 n=1 Tax=Adelges cooleyi TaxID=133065 RepID=UPI00217FA493|nr:uncharacterized protein LOC126837612 [Adelges cooleyi]